MPIWFSLFGKLIFSRNLLILVQIEICLHEIVDKILLLIVQFLQHLCLDPSFSGVFRIFNFAKSISFQINLICPNCTFVYFFLFWLLIPYILLLEFSSSFFNWFIESDSLFLEYLLLSLEEFYICMWLN